MQILGFINESGELTVELTVIGFRGETTVNAIVDTGFTGSLYLPASIIAALGMDLDGPGMSRLADGSVTRDLVFNGKIKWLERVVPVKITLSFSDEVLLGTRLLENCKLLIDYPARQFFIEK